MRLTVSLFSARTDLLCALDLAQDIELKRKNVSHISMEFEIFASRNERCESTNLVALGRYHRHLETASEPR